MTWPFPAAPLPAPKRERLPRPNPDNFDDAPFVAV